MSEKLGQTPSQTVGPYFAYGLTPGQYGYKLSDIAGPTVAGIETVPGQRIRIEGQVLDGNSAPIDDAMIEIWQADSEGRYSGTPEVGNTPFGGFARCGTGTDPEHRYFFETIKPGPTQPGHAPYIDVIVFARGLLNHAFTRLYFDDEVEANAADPVLSLIPEDRRSTLIASSEKTGKGQVYRFDIHMQGASETVFFDF